MGTKGILKDEIGWAEPAEEAESFWRAQAARTPKAVTF